MSTPTLLTVRDALARLSVGRSALYKALGDGRATGVRFGRTWRIHPSEVDRLATEGFPPPGGTR